MFKIGMALVVSLIFMACSTNKYYKDSQITLLHIDNSSEALVKLYYSVPLETMYYSSGIDYMYNNDCNQIEVKVVKQQIKTKEDVMLKSFLLKNTEDSMKVSQFGAYCYIVKIPVNQKWKLETACDGKIVKIVE